MPRSPILDQTFLTAAQCARRTGVTVKALRIYEKAGLVKPRRTEKGWRLYTSTDLDRLAAVLALKALGLSLADIRTALTDRPEGLAGTVAWAIAHWRRRKEEAARNLAIAEAAQAGLNAPDVLTLDHLCTLIRRMTMSSIPPVLKQVIDEQFTPEEQAQWAARKLAIPDAEIRRYEDDWTALIVDIKTLVAQAADPAGPAAQRALARWHTLVEAFHQSDTAGRAKSGQVWETALSRDPQGQDLPFGQDVWNFMKAAAVARS